MKHFKLNIESKFVPVADLYIAEVPKEDSEVVIQAFIHVLINNHIDFDVIHEENHTLVAKKKTTSWSISE